MPWAWQLAGFGGQVFGIPMDLGPQALYYRSDMFAQYGISPPATWDEFAAAAQKVHDANPGAYLATTPQDAYDLGALTWHAGGTWFGTANDQWQVRIDSPEAQKVAQYWQGLLDRKLVASEPTLDTAGQNIYQMFKAAAASISPNWVWGPTMTQVQPDFKDGLKKAGAGQGSIPELVTAVQANTVAAMKGQGLSVSG